TLTGMGTDTLQLTLAATEVTHTTTANARVKLTSAEGATLEIPLTVTVVNKAAELTVDPGNLSAGMLRGEQTIVRFQVTNTGSEASGPIELRLPELPWLTAATSVLPSLLAGESATASLVLSPEVDMPLTQYTGWLVLAGTDVSQRVDFAFRAVTEAKGDLRITATDEYTYYAEGSPKVAGAIVEVSDPFTNAVIRTTTTDANGVAVLQGLNAGYYTVTVRKDKHQTFTGTYTVNVGDETAFEAFLQGEYVSYTWTVTPTEIQDRTRISVESEFETNVPAPVIVVDPGVIDLTSVTEAGEVYLADLTVTNHGLIALRDVVITLPTHPDFQIQTLVDSIGELAPNSSITIPVLFKRLIAISSGNTEPEIDGAVVTAKAIAATNSQVAADGAWESNGDTTVRLNGDPPGGFFPPLPINDGNRSILDDYESQAHSTFNSFKARVAYGTEAPNLYLAYLDNTPLSNQTPVPFGPGSEVVEGGTFLAEGFRTTKNTVGFEKDLGELIQAEMRAMMRPNGELVTRFRTIDLCSVGSDGVSLPLLEIVDPANIAALLLQYENYVPPEYDSILGVIPFLNDGIPGFIAGGNGSSDFFSDYRQVSGNILLVPSREERVNPCKIRRTFEAKLTIDWEIFDTVDFIPGNAAGDLPGKLAELEAHGLSYDIPFKVNWTSNPKAYTLGSVVCASECTPCSGSITVFGIFPCGLFFRGSGATKLVRFAEDCPIGMGGSGGGDGGSGGGGGGIWFSPPVPCTPIVAAANPKQAVATADSGVCAQVRIRLDQDLVQTRSAFDATLELTNRQQSTSLTDVDIDLVVYD
ncbi:MAG: hypothetical protein FJ267_04535, partial [Planctomycetes bacterium]|nr:hypothetical protein [Planctomycetota bacterium]